MATDVLPLLHSSSNIVLVTMNDVPSSIEPTDTTPIAHDIKDDQNNDVPRDSDMHVTS